MNLGQLQACYQKAKEQSGFVEDSQLPGWKVKLASDDYKAKIGQGFFKGQPAMLVVGGSTYFNNPDSLEVLARYRLLTAEAQRGGKMTGVLLPQIWQEITSDALQTPTGFLPFNFFIQERIRGERFIGFDHRNRRKRFPHSTARQKKEIAEIYWQTVKNFDHILGQWREALIRIETKADSAAPAYFENRFHRWLEKSAEMRGNLNQRKEVKTVLKNLSYSYADFLKNQMSTGLFFRHFGNTDMIFDARRHQLYLADTELGTFPFFYGAAHYVWNVLLHLKEQEHDFSWAWREIENWREAFEVQAPVYLKKAFYPGFYLHLLERCVGALLVDIESGCSPFDGSSPSVQRRRQRAKDVFQKVFGQLRRLLRV